MSDRWCLLTSHDRNFEPIARFTVPSMRRYAERHGMDFACFVDFKIDRPPAWAKIYLTEQMFDQGYDYVLWVDADAYFRRTDDDIRHEIDADHDIYFFRERLHGPDSPQDGPLNSGLYVMRNSPLTRQLLARSEARVEFIHHAWWEQAAIMAELGYQSMLTGDRSVPDTLDPAYRDAVRWLPDKWNCFVGRYAVPDPILAHYTGMTLWARRVGLLAEEMIRPFLGSSADTVAQANDTLTEIATILRERQFAVPPDVEARLARSDERIAELEHQLAAKLHQQSEALRHQAEEGRRTLDAREREWAERVAQWEARSNSRTWLMRALWRSILRKNFRRGRPAA